MSVNFNPKSVGQQRALVIYQQRSPHEMACLETKSCCEKLWLNTYKALHCGGKQTLESKLICTFRFNMPTHSAEEMKKRLHDYEKANHFLKKLPEKEFSALIENAKVVRNGGYGDILQLTVEGVPVIVKKIRLTYKEMQHPKSTRNFFSLPCCYNYGVGSAGFGAWRELAAHKMTSEWVLSGECENFPLMYDARVLQRSSSEPMLKEEERLQAVAYWGGSEEVGIRLTALDTATHEVVVCMEKFSGSLRSDLISNGRDDLSDFERELLHVTAFMQSKGFLHFDAHFCNLLTQEKHIYFADFGLAISKEFELTEEEIAFLNKHRDYDKMYVVSELACHALEMSVASDDFERTFEDYFSSKPINVVLSTSNDSIVKRYRSLAILKDAFMGKLREDKTTSYPVQDIGSQLKHLSYVSSSS